MWLLMSKGVKSNSLQQNFFLALGTYSCAFVCMCLCVCGEVIGHMCNHHD